MSEEYRIELPKLGESIVNATVVQWFKKEGDLVERDEPLLEVSTDKVNSEIPSPVSGVLRAITAEVDQEVDVGGVLGVIVTEEGLMQEKSQVEKREEKKEEKGRESFFSPALLRLARESGVGLDELEKIPGTGAGGRISKRDLELYIEKKQEGGGSTQRVKMSGLRKAIADNMVRSFYEAPHASLVSEVDVTEVMEEIKKNKESFFEKHNAKLTITSFVARAVTRALQEYPLINSSLEDDTIVIKRYVNLGIAVSVEQGVIVPVIKNSQKMSLSSIAKEIAVFSSKVRSGNLTAEDMADGSITVTNFGMSGVVIGVPIIRYPEVAIIGVGAIHKKVAALEGDLFGIRSVVNISLTFDHRVLDGMYGCGFLGAVKKHLEGDLSLD